MFQVEICSQQLEICKSVCMFSSSPLLWRLINFWLFCSDDCRSLYLVKKSCGPMIADQEKIHGCVRFAFQLSPFLKPGCQKQTFIIMLICFIDIFCNDKAICNIFQGLRLTFTDQQPTGLPGKKSSSPDKKLIAQLFKKKSHSPVEDRKVI